MCRRAPTKGERRQLPHFAGETRYIDSNSLRRDGGDRNGAGSDYLQGVDHIEVQSVAISRNLVPRELRVERRGHQLERLSDSLGGTQRARRAALVEREGKDIREGEARNRRTMEKNNPPVPGSHAERVPARRADAAHVPDGGDRRGRSGAQGRPLLGQLDVAHEPSGATRVSPMVGEPAFGRRGNMARAGRAGDQSALAHRSSARCAVYGIPRARASTWWR